MKYFHRMVKHIQTIRRQFPTNCLSVFDHFVGLALKGLSEFLIPYGSFLEINILLTSMLLISILLTSI